MLKTITAVIEGTDAWGRVHRCELTWRPLVVEGVDPAMDEIGRSPILWGSADEPPLRFRADAVGGGVSLIKDLQVVKGGIAMAMNASPAGSSAEIGPGEYWYDVRTRTW